MWWEWDEVEGWMCVRGEGTALIAISYKHRNFYYLYLMVDVESSHDTFEQAKEVASHNAWL